MIRLATICTGIGAPEKALTNLGIPYDLVFFSEINIAAIRSYIAINNVCGSKNIGDITKIDYKKLPTDIDLIVGGTPCQDFSAAGLGRGGEDGSGTRSSIMWNYFRLVENLRPKIVVWENVAAVLSNKHKRTYRKFYCKFLSLGYKVYAGFMNAKYFNLPQNRVRIFLICIRKDMQNQFAFPLGYDSGIRIRDVLLKDVPEKYFEFGIDEIESIHINYKK